VVFLAASPTSSMRCNAVCVLGTQVSCAKMAESIVIPFGGQTRVGSPGNLVLHGVQIPCVKRHCYRVLPRIKSRCM